MKDYISGPHIATFPAGITYANVSIQITNDNIFEGNENFTLAIDSSSLPSYITISKPLQATVDIIDDDRKLSLSVIVLKIRDQQRNLWLPKM